MKKDLSSVTPEEYAIWLVNTNNILVGDFENSVKLAAAEVDRMVNAIGSIKGMGKIAKLGYYKKVAAYLESM